MKPVIFACFMGAFVEGVIVKKQSQSVKTQSVKAPEVDDGGPFQFLSFVKYREGSPSNLVGTCEVPNSTYNDWVVFLGRNFVSASPDNIFCESPYCLKIVREGKSVFLKLNGLGEVTGNDVQVTKKVFEYFGVFDDDVFIAEWATYPCEIYPLGPSDPFFPTLIVT